MRQLFKEAGYEANDKWVNIPSELSSNYLLYLAREVAAKNDLSLITKDWGAWTATNYFSIDGAIDECIRPISENHESGFPFGLYTLILKELSPVNIQEIPSAKILEFRLRRKDEIKRFRNSIISLHQSLNTLDAPELKRDAIIQQIEEFKRAQADYQKSADLIKATGGWKTFTMMGFPAAVSFSSIFNVYSPMQASLATATLLFGALFHLKSTESELMKLNKQNPISFVVEMDRAFEQYTSIRGGGDATFHAYNCMEEYEND